MRRDETIGAALLAAAVVVLGFVYGGRAAAGSDAYGYVSQAELWRTTGPKVEQPWVAETPWPSRRWSFTPLGYRPSFDADEPWTIVPMYTAGLPLLMAAAKTVAGQCAMFWLVPLAGGSLVLATFGIGCRLASSRAGLIAAWLVATSPAVLHMLMLPMTDVPVAAAWAIAFCFGLGRGVPNAAAAGLAAAVAIFIRPNLAPGAAVIAVWLVAQWWRASAGDRSAHARRALVFIVLAAAGAMTVAGLNAYVYGSPFRSGYTGTVTPFTWQHVWPNVRLYGFWFVETQTPLALAGIAAVVLPWRRLWPDLRDRSVLAMFAAFIGAVVVPYLGYFEFDAWWYLRFFLSCWPLVMLGLASVILALAGKIARPWGSVVAATLVIGLGVFGVDRAIRRGVFLLWQAEWRYVAAARLVAVVTEPTSVIFSRQHSGSLRYYAGRLTLSFQHLDNDWLDRSAAWLAERGRHPYLLIEDWEIPMFERQFAGQQTLAHLAAPPVFLYEGAARVALFDLQTLRPPSAAVDRIVERYDSVRCEGPVPPPVVNFAR